MIFLNVVFFRMTGLFLLVILSVSVAVKQSNFHVCLLSTSHCSKSCEQPTSTTSVWTCGQRRTSTPSRRCSRFTARPASSSHRLSSSCCLLRSLSVSVAHFFHHCRILRHSLSAVVIPLRQHVFLPSSPSSSLSLLQSLL